MKWYYNDITGAVVQMPSWSPSLLIPGWHGAFNTKEEALAFYNQQKADHPQWQEPTGILGNIGNVIDAPQVGRTLASDTKENIIETVIGKWHLDRLLLQAAEIILGTVLIGVGIAKLTGTTNFVVNTLGKVTSLGKTAVTRGIVK